MNNFNNSKYKGNGLTFNGQQAKKNEQNNDDVDLFAAPLSLGGLGSAGKWKGAQAFRGAAPTMFDAHGLSEISGAQPMAAKQQQTVINSKVMIAPNSAFSGLDGLDTTPISFGGNMKAKAPQLMVLPNAVVDDDFTEFKREPIVFVPSKCMGNGLEATPAIYNEFQSIVVDETPSECLSKFRLILDAFSNDISYQVDAANHVINGQIFMAHHAVYFKISIWSESVNSDNARFEVRRSKGDSVKFQEFWNEIESIIYSKFTNPKGPSNNADSPSSDSFGFDSLPPMDYDFELTDDEAQDVSFSSEDLDNIVAELREEDPFVVFSLAMLLDAFKAQAKFIQIILNHAHFIETVLEKAIGHNDIALVRAALITLERVCESNEGAQLLVAYNVLDRVVPLLASQNELLQKYAVRLLAKLSTVSSWKFDNGKMKKFAQVTLKECEKKWENCRFASADFIKSTMFESINAALISAN